MLSQQQNIQPGKISYRPGEAGHKYRCTCWRVQITGACRLPQWLADWVMKEGDEGRKIEKALIGYYGLKPPAKTVIISSRA